MDNQKDPLRGSLIKRYHVLANLLGMGTEERAQMLCDNYGVDSSTQMTTTDLVSICSKLQARVTAIQKEDNTDLLRKRLIGAIGGYLEAIGQDRNDTDKIKRIACRSAETKSFNAIPKRKLTSIYAAFTRRTKDIRDAKK